MDPARFDLNLLRLLPLPRSIPPFQVNQYWHRRVHRDPANQWLRENFARLLRQWSGRGRCRLCYIYYLL